MKNAVYIIGVIAGLALVLGIFFKAKSLPGAGSLLVFSTIINLIFIPLFAVYQYRKDSNLS